MKHKERKNSIKKQLILVLREIDIMYQMLAHLFIDLNDNDFKNLGFKNILKGKNNIITTTNQILNNYSTYESEKKINNKDYLVFTDKNIHYVSDCNSPTEADHYVTKHLSDYNISLIIQIK